MTRIDFYSIDNGDRWLLACRLAARAQADKLRVLLHCVDNERARQLDRLLWTFREDSFVPHGLLGEVDAALTPVLIGPLDQAPEECGVLINLELAVPEGFTRFARLCEPLDNDPAVLSAGRARWAHYRAAGYPLNHHRIGS